MKGNDHRDTKGLTGKLEQTTQKKWEEGRDWKQGKRIRKRAGGWDWLVKEKGTELGKRGKGDKE